jgi:HD-GYP domain-containing protein (c-di-GMP phosphodiesterase class II)
LVSIVDVYDALRSARAYKPGRPRGEAMTEMSRMRERFDPELLAAFCNAETAMDATYRAAGGR